MSIKDFRTFFSAIYINVPYSFLSYHCKFGETDPAPVDRNIWYLTLFELLAGFDVEDLNNCLVSSASSYSDHVALLMHQNAVGFHISAVNFEVLGGVDDCDLLKV
jgi:hypothetical protein